jgi:hypothetical protein
MFDIKGDRPQWQTIHERLSTMDIGDVIKDNELTALLPDAAATSISGAFWRAVREIETDKHRTFDRIRTIGYRMVNATEHAGLARRHHKKAKRQLRTAERKAHSADRSRLTREECQRIDAIELNLSRQREMTARLESKVHREIRERKAGEAHLSERVDELAKLLARHGITDQTTTEV